MTSLGPDLRLLWGQIRHQNRVFWRTPVAAFFTLALPILFLVLFNVIFNDPDVAPGYEFSQFFAPAMAVFATGTSTFTTLAIGTAFSRDQGILKRVRGTPLPPWIYMGGKIGSAVWLAVLSVAIMFTVGWAFFGFVMIWSNLGVAALVFGVGVATFSALGLAVCGLGRSADTTPAVANGLYLPLTFISGIFIPLDDAPRWLLILGDIFPLKHLTEPFAAAFDPFHSGAVVGWENLAVMGAWLLLGLVVNIRFFRWDPKE